jgi:glycosyltransferase involved in cell wall biosynthesis
LRRRVDGPYSGNLGAVCQTDAVPVRLVINDQRLGWRENFLKSASLCTSEYIVFCDQDDVWIPDKLSVVYRYLDSDRCILLQHGYRLIDDDGNFISGDIKYPQTGRDVLWRINFGFSLVFHRSLLKLSHLWELSVDHLIDAKVGYDSWIAFLGSLFDKRLVIDDVLVYYRQHNTNVVGFAHPVNTINMKRNLSTILSRVYGRSDEFEKKRQVMIYNIQRRAMAAAARERIIGLIMPQVSEEQARSLSRHLQYYREVGRYQSQRLIVYFSESRVEGSRRRSAIIVKACTKLRAAGEHERR